MKLLTISPVAASSGNGACGVKVVDIYTYIIIILSIDTLTSFPVSLTFAQRNIEKGDWPGNDRGYGYSIETCNG